MQEKERNRGMCILQILVQCCDRFFEVLSDDVEGTELTVEDGVGRTLLDLFEEVTVDDVAICFSSHLGMGFHRCSIQICAHCSCQGFSLLPRTKEHIRLSVEKGISTILKELFGSVSVEYVSMRPASCENGNALCCI